MIDTYLSRLFIPALMQHGVPEDQSIRVAKDVRARLNSVISRWNDEKFRETLLTIGREEATHYQPLDANIDIRSLVVIAVRNSALEDICSVDQAAKLYGLPKAVALDAYMQNITGAAITYFQKVDLAAEATQLALPEAGDDPFGNLSEIFPATWTALSHLGNPVIVKRAYEPVQTYGKFPTLSAHVPESTKKLGSGVVLSGMDLTVDPLLREHLNGIACGRINLFFTPSFKHITRHPRKLFEVMEYVLHHGGVVVSPNFYLANGYVARRTALLRPIHYNRDIPSVVREAIPGTKGLHRQALVVFAAQVPVA